MVEGGLSGGLNRLEVRFKDEFGDDLGGITRDWMDSLGRAISDDLLCSDTGIPGVPKEAELGSKAALDLVTVGRLTALSVIHAIHMRVALHPLVSSLKSSTCL